MFEIEQQQLVDYLGEQLIGPIGGLANESLEGPPDEQYLMGMLFPRKKESTDYASLDGEDFDEGNDSGLIVQENNEESGDNPKIPWHGQYLPSSIGLSFLIENEASLSIEISAGRYKKDSENKLFHREPLTETIEIQLSLEPIKNTEEIIFDGKAKVFFQFRDFKGNKLVTLALVNISEEVLAQVKIECFSKNFLRYPTSPLSHQSDEDKEMAFVYRDIPAFAAGHGCSVEWETSDGIPEKISTSFIPDEELPGITFDIEGHEDALDLRELKNLDKNQDEIIHNLRRFSAAYREWIQERSKSTEITNGEEELIAENLKGRLLKAADRIDEGISLLDTNSDARTAFALANEAMLMQMHHVGRASRRNTLEESKLCKGVEIDYEAERKAWRPFQLAFILLTLPSVSDPDHGDRDIVDLIWFPTGGGKTEAYLGLVAYQIVLRRLNGGDLSAGTTVITRYTLRLLTSQQFQRSSTLICALEWLRRNKTEELNHRLGQEQITIGLWVGENSTPNSYQGAIKALKSLRDNPEEADVSFQVEFCPWCGTDIVPADGNQNQTHWGIIVSNNAVKIACVNPDCDFKGGLPVNVVDDELYKNPPTFLLGTVDKFAQFAWSPEPGVFLGAGDYPGPSLVIQDELHLLAGPLGTIAALYETAFDILVSESKNSCRPKMIASTATIRRANEQVNALFHREVFQFPPKGLSHDDSFFVRNDESVPGRRYLGVMAQSHSPVTANVRTTAALLQAPIECGLEGVPLDSYWTLVFYHNSLRELGKTINLLSDDVPDRIKVISSLTDDDARREIGEIKELTSNVKGRSINTILDDLSKEHNPENGEPAISVLPCSNMIQVGIDVERLSLMLVNGQPKTTSEYIQATSRVGRDVRKRPPGLVVTLFSASKPRDRSHYESFKTYHQRIYSSVEPTSVTPWASPARRRALHATLVILVRHLLEPTVLNLNKNKDAKKFKDVVSHNLFGGIVEKILERPQHYDSSEYVDTARHLNELIEEWKTKASSPESFPYVDYSVKNLNKLLAQFESSAPDGLTPPWKTLGSMRNVDISVEVKTQEEPIWGRQNG